MSGPSSQPNPLAVIKLSDEFLKLLRMDAESAYALQPVFATRFERMSQSNEKWIPRVLLLSLDGTMRIFEPDSGRITHAFDLVSSQRQPVRDDDPPAKVKAFEHFHLVVESASNADKIQSVRFMGHSRGEEDNGGTKEQGKQPSLSSIKETKQDDDESSAGSDAHSESETDTSPASKNKLVAPTTLAATSKPTSNTKIEVLEDLLMRFHCDAAPLALKFASAVRYFLSLREDPTTSTVSRTTESLEKIFKDACQKKEHSIKDDGVKVIRPRKVSRVAQSLKIFKSGEATSIREFGKQEKQKIVCEGGSIVAPTESPRAIGEDKKATKSQPKGNDDNELSEGPQSIDDASQPSHPPAKDDWGSFSEETVTSKFLMPSLVTVSRKEQEEMIASAFLTFLREKQQELATKTNRNVERMARHNLLRARILQLQEQKEDEMSTTRRCVRHMEALSVEVCDEYITAKSNLLNQFVDGLMRPAAVFDAEEFHNYILDSNALRDELSDQLEDYRRNIATLEDMLSVPLVEDPVYVTAVEESRMMIDRVLRAQEEVKRLRQEIQDTCAAQQRAAHESCTATLLAQVNEITEKRKVLKKLQGLFALHEELTRGFPARGSPGYRFDVAQLGERERKDYMKMDL